MPSVTYYGSFDGVAGSDGLTTTLKAAQTVPANAVIKNVSYSLRITAGGYSSSNDWNLTELAVGGSGGSPYAFDDATMYSNEHTFSGNMNYRASDVSKFASNAIQVYAAAYTTHSSKSYLWDVEITVEYSLTSACGAPSNVELSAATSYGSNVTLFWKAGTAGTDNAITGYEVQRCESSNGSSWGSWSTLTTTTATSLSVEPPATYGKYYRYRVRTRGTAGASYYSGWVTSGSLQRVKPTLTAYTDPTIVANETKVKAIHMLELQSNINTMRTGRGLSAYTFAEIRAGYTSLAGWNNHIKEMRTAIDAMTTNHEAWLPLGENAPRAEVIMQLRRVVDSL